MKDKLSDEAQAILLPGMNKKKGILSKLFTKKEEDEEEVDLIGNDGVYAGNSIKLR